jgi:hypothetical protein
MGESRKSLNSHPTRLASLVVNEPACIANRVCMKPGVLEKQGTDQDKKTNNDKLIMVCP